MRKGGTDGEERKKRERGRYRERNGGMKWKEQEIKVNFNVVGNMECLKLHLMIHFIIDVI